jgi:hypothetical protein
MCKGKSADVMVLKLADAGDQSKATGDGAFFQRLNPGKPMINSMEPTEWAKDVVHHNQLWVPHDNVLDALVGEHQSTHLSPTSWVPKSD